MSDRKLFVLLFVVLILISTGVHGSCPIELSPPRVVVKYGDPVSVNCSTPGLKGIGWEASEGGTGLQPVSNLPWTVDSLTVWGIQPMCFLFSDGHECSKTLEVVLYTFPETISISSSNQPNGMVKEGEQHNFTCHINKIAPVGNLIITWYKGDRIIKTVTLNSDNKKPTNQSSVFSFTPAKEDNNAMFRCEAYMDLGPDGPQFNVSSPEYQIQVLYGPEHICSSTYTVLEYSHHNLTCSRGFPEPMEIWYKDDEEVDLPKILTRGDAGQYWVTASNDHSKINFTVDIIVHYPPAKIYELEDAEVNASASVGLKCFSVGSPRPKYSWSYYQTDNVIETTEDGVSRLRIENATGYNTGSYTCHAWNERGNVSKTVRVTVKGVHGFCPIELSPPRVVVKYGDPVSVNCSTPGLKGIGWEASEGGTGLEPVSNLPWTVESLTEWGIQPMCFLFSDDHECSKTLEVVLYTFPETISISSINEPNGMVKEGEQHNFTCHINKIAPVGNLTITWYKGDRIIKTVTLNSDNKKPTNQSSVFSFTPAKEDNNTMFRCEAYMDLGPDGPQFNVSSPEYQIQVLYGPEHICPSTYTVLEYSHHNLTCSRGFPEPMEIWYKDDEEVDLPKILTRGDAGQYRVTASNDHSKINFTVDIIVHYPPSEIYELEDAEVNAGASVELKCFSVGSPRPKYSWSYYQTNNVIETTEDGVSRLRIENATGYNTGSYTCHAWNERGKVSKTVRVTVKGGKQECPITITPDAMVLQYKGENRSAICKLAGSDSSVKPNWNVSEGTRIFEESWIADTQTDWDPKPACYAEFNGERCYKHLPYTLYKTPDSVSVSVVDGPGVKPNDTELQLQCDIINVAPAQNLTVQWRLIKGSKNGTLAGNNRSCNFIPVRSPVNVSCNIIVNISLNNISSGTEIRCEPQLDLGIIRPITRDQFGSTVFYEPSINTTQLPEKVPVIRGYSETLICKASGNPPPKIEWSFSYKSARLDNGTLTVFEAGQYNCIATNALNSYTHVVTVVLKEDYLPLIAGFVAVTVVAISIVFLFIYSIYYKNTKMRRYSLKNPKLSNHNGNVAHNGWDTQFPMTKLS